MEHEAHALADRLLSEPAPSVATKLAVSPSATEAGGGGRPLDARTLAYFEPRLGADLGGVRVHDDAAAAAEAASRDAHGYTRGADIVFGAGRHSPGTPQGARLLAHELVHVVQQRSPAVTATGLPLIQREAAGTGSRPSPQAFIEQHVMELAYERYGPVAREVALAMVMGDYAWVRGVFDVIASGIEDNVGAEALSHILDPALERIASTRDGRALLDLIYEAVITGSVSNFEREQANRVLFAGVRATASPDAFADKATRRADGRPTPVFPVKFMGVFGGDYAPPYAELLPNGRVRVKYPVAVKYMSTFAAQIRTLPDVFTGQGAEFDADEIVRVKLYEQGGQEVPLPALALIDYSNQAIKSTTGKIIEVSVFAATLGSGALAGKAATGVARAFQIADRVAAVVPMIALLVSENREWLIARFPRAGRALVRAAEIADTVVKIYGVGRLAQSVATGGYRFVQRIRTSSKACRDEALALTAGEAKVLDQIDADTDALIKQLEAANAESAGAKGAAGSAPDAVPSAAASPPLKPPTQPLRPAPGRKPLGPMTSTPSGARAYKASNPIVETRSARTLDYGEPVASASPRSASTTRAMRKPSAGTPRGTVSSEGGTPVARPRSNPVVETRTSKTLDYGVPESSATPQSKGPDPWQAPAAATRPATPRAPPGHHPQTGQAAAEGQAMGLDDLDKGRVPMQEHRTASAVRAATGRQGLESTHIVPQAVYRAIGRDPNLAETVLLPKAVNNAIDAGWVGRWNRAMRLGQRITGADVKAWLEQSIRDVPTSMLSEPLKGTLGWRLELELSALGITPDRVVVPGL